jgi:hypothetical protein
MFAPILAGVARAVVAWTVFTGFKMLVRSLNRELPAPAKRQRITARARILTEEARDWSEPQTGQAHRSGARAESE